MTEIDELKQAYAENVTLKIGGLLDRHVELYGLKGAIEKYCIMRDSLWEITDELSNSDASSVTDAIAVIECILTDLKAR